MTLRPAKNIVSSHFSKKNERITNVFEGAMCQWHMFSTDRSRAEMREHAVQSNPVSEGSKAFDPNIII